MSDITERPDSATEPRLDGDHIIDWRDPRNDAACNSEKPVDVYRMLCGEEVPVTLDAELLREGFDFYDFDNGAKASCPVCLAIWRSLSGLHAQSHPEGESK